MFSHVFMRYFNVVMIENDICKVELYLPMMDFLRCSIDNEHVNLEAENEYNQNRQSRSWKCHVEYQQGQNLDAKFNVT